MVLIPIPEVINQLTTTGPHIVGISNITFKYLDWITTPNIWVIFNQGIYQLLLFQSH